MRPIHIHLVSLGCPKNLVDSEVILGRLGAGGFRVTSEAADADVLMVNTCGFIEAAKEESIDHILEACEQKENDLGKKVVVAGCLGQRYPAELAAEIPAIDAIVGLSEYHRMPLGALLLLGTLGLALRLWGTQTLSVDRTPPRLFSFGVLWLVITLSPVSNVLFLSGVLLAERTFYLPSVGFVALLAWIGAELYQERRRLAGGALILILMLMSIRTVTRNATWRNNLTVFDVLIREHPESGRAQWLVGDTQHMVGNRKAGNGAYRITIGLLNGSYPVLVDVGRRLFAYGETEAAKALLRRAWEEYPDEGIAPRLLAGIHYGERDYPGAIEAAEAAITYYGSQDLISNHLLAHSLAVEGRWEESVQARRRTIEAGEGHRWQQWFWLAEAYAQSGDTARALESLDSARTRVRPPDEPGQIGRFQAVLRSSENANASQNPATDGR